MPIISAAGRWKQDVIQSLPAQLHEFQVSLDYNETWSPKGGCGRLNSKSQLLVHQQALIMRENELLGFVCLNLPLDSLDTGTACLAFCSYIKSTKCE